MQALLDPSNMDKAVQVISTLDGSITGKSLKVNKATYLIFLWNAFSLIVLVIVFQTCVEVYDMLASGDFGPAGKNVAETYREKCCHFFPYASKFKAATTSNSNNNNHNNSNSNEIEP